MLEDFFLKERLELSFKKKMGNAILKIPEFDHFVGPPFIQTYVCAREENPWSVLYEVKVQTPSTFDVDAIEWVVKCLSCECVSTTTEKREGDWYFGLITKAGGDRQRTNGTIRAVLESTHTFSLQKKPCENEGISRFTLRASTIPEVDFGE